MTDEIERVARIIILLAGVYYIVQALILNTHNFRSALFFKVIPFFFGASLIGIFLLMSGIVLAK